jgi:hypothetical protein
MIKYYTFCKVIAIKHCVETTVTTSTTTTTTTTTTEYNNINRV